MNCISTKNLNISYGNLDIVKDLNLNIPKGKITTIIGANGCGKSTVLKTIARIIQPKSGDIYINDKNIKEQSSKDLAKTMAVLPQSPQAPSGLTVEELIAYGRFPHQKGFGKLKKEDTDIVTWALEVTGIEEFRDRPIEALSGGQRQRISIARAFLKDAPILILDEMTSNVDPVNESLIQDAITELAKNRTVLVVAHHLKTIQKADQILVFQKGNLLQKGKHGELLEKDGYYTKLWKAQYEV